MEHLDNGTEANPRVGDAAARTCREQQEHRPNALSTPSHQVGGDFGDDFYGGGGLAGKLNFDSCQVIPYEVEDFGSRRDGNGPHACLE